jgi:hypothetical protein
LGAVIARTLLITIVVGTPFVFWPVATAITYTAVVVLGLPISKLACLFKARKMLKDHSTDLSSAEVTLVRQYPFFFISTVRSASFVLMLIAIKYAAILLAIGLAIAQKWIWIPLAAPCWICASFTMLDYDPLSAIAKYAKEEGRKDPQFDQNAYQLSDAIGKLTGIFSRDQTKTAR